MVSYPLYEFKQQHPDVEVITDFQPYTEDDPFGEAFFKRISAEVMSGNGPDTVSYTHLSSLVVSILREKGR